MRLLKRLGKGKEHKKTEKKEEAKEEPIIKKEKKEHAKVDIKRNVMSIVRNRFDIPHFKAYLEKAGIEYDLAKISITLRNLALVCNFLVTVYFAYKVFSVKPDVVKGLVFILAITIFGFIGLLMLVWLVFYFYVDSRVKQLGTRQMPSKTREKTPADRKRLFATLMEKAGIEIPLNKVSLFLFRIAVVVNLIINTYLFYNYSDIKPGLVFTVTTSVVLWTLGFMLLLLLLWVLFFFYIDLKIYKRKKEIEDVLPDFLQLTSANISSGMTIDRALWFAVRPRFGVLAHEIEDVAKSTLTGEKLVNALLKFSNKYDSVILQRSINLLLEGLESGGNVGPLLNKISINIQEQKILRKEMAANVTTYIIFITFASIVAAPFLFALSTELIVIMQKILGNIEVGGGGGGSMGIMSIDASGLDLGNFKLFVYLSLGVTAFFSAVIISIIKNGNVKDGLQYIPIYMVVSYIIYTLSFAVLSMALGGMF